MELYLVQVKSLTNWGDNIMSKVFSDKEQADECYNRWIDAVLEEEEIEKEELTESQNTFDGDMLLVESAVSSESAVYMFKVEVK